MGTCLLERSCRLIWLISEACSASFSLSRSLLRICVAYPKRFASVRLPEKRSLHTCHNFRKSLRLVFPPFAGAGPRYGLQGEDLAFFEVELTFAQLLETVVFLSHGLDLPLLVPGAPPIPLMDRSAVVVGNPRYIQHLPAMARRRFRCRSLWRRRGSY
jgi:hypothetical protein